MLTLHNLQKNESNAKPGKRRGRGNASGAGNYSGRGIKGQKARSGGRVGLKVKSIKSYLLRIPKVRGFKSFYGKMQVINTGDLEKHFKAGNEVNFRAMVRAGLIFDTKQGVKVLAKGSLTKNLKIEANAFSRTAEAQIVKAGGQAIVVSFLRDKKEAAATEAKVE